MLNFKNKYQARQVNFMRKMIAAVICRDGKFLVLRRKLRWKGWEFVKGKIEKEGLRHAALREVREETGLKKIHIVCKLPIEVIYHHKDMKGHTVSALKAFLAECHGGSVRLSREHSSFRWVTVEQAEKLLTFDTHKIFLRAAAEHFAKKNREEKRRLIEKLSRKHVRFLKYDGKWISLKYDNRRLRCLAVRRSVKDIGDWSKRKNVVYYDRNLPGHGVLAILLHEVVEKYVAQQYALDVDKEAHKVAQAVEKEWLADKEWIVQAKIVSRAWVKTNHRKVGKARFY